MKLALKVPVLVAALVAPLYAAHAQNPLPAETRLATLAGAAAATEETITIASATDLVITLKDLQVPAALTSASVVVTQGGAIVGPNPPSSGSATLVAPVASATVTIPGAVGSYTLRVFGQPNANSSIGTFSLCVAPAAAPANCMASESLVGTLSTPVAASNPTQSTVSETLTVTTAGNYLVSYADDQFPVALGTAPSVALFQGSTPVGPTPLPSGTSVALTPGTYTLLAFAAADSTVKAGLYGIAITGPAGVAPLLNTSYPVGILAPASPATNPMSQTLTLKVTDFAFPAALASASALVTAGGVSLGAPSTAAAASSFTASAGPLQVWSYAAAGTDAGTYEVDLTSLSGSLLQTAAGVSNGISHAEVFITSSQPSGTLAAGAYQATATDFKVPTVLLGLQLAVAQNGVILARGSASGTPLASTFTFPAAAGPAILLVDAITQSGGSDALFDVNVTTTDGATLEFDQTVGVSQSDLFDSQTVNLAAGSFNVTLTDLMFPASFQNLALVISRGGTVLGTIFAGGTFPINPTAAGSYLLTFAATPAAAQQYGLYAVQITNAPPTVTLSASPTSVTSGAMTTLSWTTTGASACTASGGTFTGNEATGSGSAMVSVAATTTYTLTCTGPGGSGSASATVTATAAPATTSGGGGGALDAWVLGALALVVMARRRVRLPANGCTFSRRERSRAAVLRR
jgi:hypothetical protein